MSLLSKGLKFVPTANKIDQAKLKRELEEYGRKLRLMWHFRNDERLFSQERFKPKSTFNPRNKDAVIETYLSCLEERLLDIDIPSKRFNNLTKDERNAMYSLKDDKSIIIKGADKGLTVIVWDREDYIKEATKQLEDKEAYMEVPNDSSALVSTIFKSLEKIRKHGDLSQDTLNYFLLKDPKFARFYLLPKIHKRLHDVPGRPVISNCGFYTKNISSFLDFHLQPLGQKVKSFIKDTNHFLKKIKELGQLPEGTALEEKILSVWWRYIDDICFIWEHGEESLQEFINEIDSFNPTIKFTTDWSKEKVNFLDVEVTLKNSVLSTDLFVKPTDTHEFLDPTSCHPYHCKKVIIKVHIGHI